MLRQLDSGDLADVVKAELECFPEDAWTWGRFADMLTMPGAFNLVLREGKVLIGYLISSNILDEAPSGEHRHPARLETQGIGANFSALLAGTGLA